MAYSIWRNSVSRLRFRSIAATSVRPSKLPQVFHALWVVTRPLSHIKNIVLAGLAFVLAGADIVSFRFFLVVAALSFFWSAFYIYNALEDIETDRKNPSKKHYAEAITLLGSKGPIAFGFFLAGGVFIALSLGSAMLVVLGAMGLTAFLYSSKRTRFKERRYLNVVFGGVLTYPLRFLAGWVVASASFPPLLPIFSLAAAKAGGYFLYKEFDREVLMAQGVRSAAVALRRGTVPFFFLVSLLAVAGMLLNVYTRFPYLGVLPLRILWLLPFAALPLAVVFAVLRRNARVISYRRPGRTTLTTSRSEVTTLETVKAVLPGRLRTLGLVYLFLIAVVAWRLLV